MAAQGSETAVPSPESKRSESIPAWGYGEHSWVVQQLHQLIGDFGALKEAVETLKGSVKDQGIAINAVKRTIYIATGIVIGAGAVLTFLLDRGIDRLIGILAAE